MLSRYLATVRRAMSIPCSASRAVSLASLSGRWVGSESIIDFSIAQTAVEEHSPPAAVFTWLEKKYLSSKIQTRQKRLYSCAVLPAFRPQCYVKLSLHWRRDSVTFAITLVFLRHKVRGWMHFAPNVIHLRDTDTSC